MSWHLLEQKEQAEREGKWETYIDLDKQIKKAIRKDKERAKLDQLEEKDKDGYKWDGLKRMKAKFTPEFNKFKDSEGNRVPATQYAQKAAEYLKDNQWKKNEALPERKKDPKRWTENINKIKNTDFNMSELNYVINKLTTKKAPGSDLLITELIKWMDRENREIILGLVNDIRNQNELEDILSLANVVSIYKKGDSTSLANYKPISLLQSFYKIIAALVKERIDAGIDDWITKTQYGFRKGRSTAQAIYIARRLLDISEREGTNISLILLDWEKAFDKIDQERLLEALERAGISGFMLHIITLLYKNPQFRVCVQENESEYFKQEAGI